MDFMKNKLSIFTLFLTLWAGMTNPMSGFSGIWINHNSFLPKIKITQERNSIMLSAWQKYGTGMRSIGTVNARYISTTSSIGSEVLTASYNISGENIQLRLTRDGSFMKVQIRNAYSEVEYYKYSRFTRRDESMTGSIYGNIMGPAKSTASIFQILLYGPDNGNQLIERKGLGRNKTFSFEGLPDGTYWMVVRPRGNTRVLPFPSEKKIIIRNGEAINQNVELK